MTNDVAQPATAWNAPEVLMGTSTLRALAWSDEADPIAEPVPYFGEGDAVSQSSSRRFRLPALIFGIAATAATMAAGGLVLTLTGTEAPAPVTTVRPAQPQVSQPSQPVKADGVTRDGGSRSSRPVSADLPAVEAAPRVATAPHSVSSAPQPEAGASSPTRMVTAEPEATPAAAIQQSAEAADAPAAPAPAEPAPELVPPPAAPQPPAAPVPPLAPLPPAALPPLAFPPLAPLPPAALPPLAFPPLAPPVVTPPIVSLSPVAPEAVPHPVGPPVFHVPDAPAAPNPALPSGPVIQVPAAASNPGIGLPAGTTLTPLVPKLP